MLKWFSILCSMMYVLATTNAGEVLKVPMFVEHFMEYHGSLSEFVMEHYDNHKQDSDWDTDQKLPFINPPIVLTVHAQLPELSFEIKKPKEITVSKKTSIYKEKDFFQQYLSQIFQPPRLS
ncbi:hypothetical protein NK356_01190 [Chryseobacterium sp. S0630]|uniref:hypothetical protein n=1 Tax=unclassified Chryseobacterium TaxID=2593645 RepID=UPI0012E01A94|nr:hypothetical protein [Chryseobacterium sp. S0630]MCP1297784.1 hypothetical protein [Chryseobacterium sp. S0630]